MTGRRAGLAPTLALLVGVAVAATAAPLVSGASTDGGASAPSPPSTTVAPSTEATTNTTVAPSTEATTSTPPAGPSVLRIQVVPAVRDVVVLVDDERYSSDGDGLIEATTASDEASITVLGYSVSPSFQQVAFTGWGDGSTETARTLAATGDDAEVDLGVEVSYRVTVEAENDGDAVDQVRLSSDQEAAPLPPLTPGEPTWVPARRAVDDGAGGLAAEDLTYRAQVEGGPPSASPSVAPTPEGVIEVG